MALITREFKDWSWYEQRMKEIEQNNLVINIQKKSNVNPRYYEIFEELWNKLDLKNLDDNEINKKKKEIRGKVYYILNKEKVLEKTNKYNKSRAEMVNKIKREKYKNDEEFRKKVNEKNNKWNREHNGKNKNII